MTIGGPKDVFHTYLSTNFVMQAPYCHPDALTSPSLAMKRGKMVKFGINLGTFQGFLGTFPESPVQKGVF